ncbi:sigma-70 family RNA polymerase sigma factor [Rhizobacter sp. SG703]|uniref:sigma-70 family RNA polymerase sigma factor n=1 Tax=Rhizobacter sp. SG703 TaxID=2587140 RepID=UPI00182C16A6|nr:sigma-70 family RNA polymerase sigma factor [Rhizobacter sp. SG703]NKI97511.1 RNA polymerase sigma-70 factor (ECF subfamily) [Rhizobacter sp. SG703]
MTLVPSNPEQARDDDWGSVLTDVATRQDRAAFARLFAHFAPRVKRYLMQCGSPDVLAEELTQDAMAAVWRKATLFDPGRAAASTWIFAIARNLRVDALRRRQGLESRADDDVGAFDFDQLESDQPSPEDHLETQRLNQRLHGALARLPPEQLQVLRLSYFDDEPHVRIAAELGIPLGTAKSRVRLAVAQLRRLLER